MKEVTVMKKILFVNACIRENHSRTYKIAKDYLAKLEKSCPIEIIERRLTDGEISYLTSNDFSQETGEIKENGDYVLAKEFAAADGIIIAAPFWEFAFPAVLSCYLENVSVPNITFRYTPMGSEGLCKAKVMIYIYTSGDVFAEEDNIGNALLLKLSKLYGIPNFDTISAKGLDIDETKVSEIIATTLQGIDEKAKTATNLL